MATVESLRDRLANRLGLSTFTSIEGERLYEALYAALARVYSDGDSGFAHSELTAETYGSSAITVSAHTANTSTLTLSAIPTGTAVGDVLVIGSKSWLIYDYGALSIDVGGNIKASLAAETGTIYHRTVQLPTTAAVLSVVDLTHNRALEHDPGGLVTYGLNIVSDPQGYEQRYSREGGTSYIGLWPCPSSAVQIAIKQGFAVDTLTASTNIEATEAFFDKVLGKAVAAWRSWRTGGPTQGEAAASSRETEDTKQAGGHSKRPQTRSGMKARGR